MWAAPRGPQVLRAGERVLPSSRQELYDLYHVGLIRSSPQVVKPWLAGARSPLGGTGTIRIAPLPELLGVPVRPSHAWRAGQGLGA